MQVIGKFILNLIADSIATLIHNIFLALLTVIMDFVSRMIVSLWDDTIINAIVSCSSWIAMGVFVVGLYLFLRTDICFTLLNRYLSFLYVKSSDCLFM